jgi:LysM repeat protein
VAALVWPATSSATIHQVASGESLASIAAQDGLTVSQLAAANGLSPDSLLTAGAVIQIPPQAAAGLSTTAVSAPVSAAGAAGPACAGDEDSDDTGCQPASSVSTSSASAPVGSSYVVQPGDTLSAIAARAGTTVAALAAANNLDVNGVLPAGATLALSGLPSAPTYVSTGTTTLPQTTAATATSEPQGAVAQGDPAGPPYPTPERLSASEVGQIGAANGATSSLTDAIGWQESGFNNDLVSTADARGIMQILPGTWQWIQHSLDTGAPLAPASAVDNVRGGALMLNWLLRQTGGDPALAAAGYYQGLTSVREHGMYPDTQQYVQSVMALRAQYGGG